MEEEKLNPDTLREEAEKYLEGKELKMHSPMEGYIIPYSYLVTLLTEFASKETD